MFGHPYMQREHHASTLLTAPLSSNQGRIMNPRGGGGPYTTMPPPHLLHRITRVRW
jgi:hypothetical protein